jgi:hypothetical protein
MRETHEVHETVRERLTMMDRTVFEQVARAGLPAARIAAPHAAAQAEPEIHVSIGRIEVRAVNETSPARKSKQESPVMGLDEYLRSKKGAAQ